MAEFKSRIPRRIMKLFSALILPCIAFIFAGCNQTASAPTNNANTTVATSNTTPAKPPFNRATEEARLKAADTAWSDAAGKKDVELTVSFMAEDGATLPPNQPIAKGKDAMKKDWAALLALKDVAIKWEPTTVQVSEGGELGFTSGTYTLSFTDEKGTKVNDKGKYLEVWKKIGGEWKCYLDSYNSDGPAK
ncbi:MAG: DUF4440 domain-containing protein [Acidobacteria bacterium]|nr:MAG: DUF4440 domain-containing protein [Acidobacteriota bacterium]